MNGKPQGSRKTQSPRWATSLAVMLCCAGWAGAQPGPEPARPGFGPPVLGRPAAAESMVDPNVVPVGCSTCSQGLLGGGHGGCAGGDCGGCGAGCGGRNCVPGRENCCSDCVGRTALGRMLCGLYDCICCPDPCYEPRWCAQANAAFFVDGARPVNQMRLRWDAVYNFTLPDRSEFFWARADGMGKGPSGRPPFPPTPPPPGTRFDPRRETNLRYHELTLTTETMIGPMASLAVEMPYRSLDPDVNPHAAGFADMNIAAKTLLFDCELLQVATQFRTFIPIGNFSKGLGTGHVSLEPSVLFALKLMPDTYLQGMVAEWIPIGGDNDYQGSILHYHFALNQVLYRILPDVPLIGTLEFNGYSFQDGAFTDPTLGAFQKSSGETYISIGPGLRLVVCDRIDFGIGTAFAIGDHGPGQVYRTEFRWRF